jgi:hypothetical protein
MPLVVFMDTVCNLAMHAAVVIEQAGSWALKHAPLLVGAAQAGHQHRLRHDEVLAAAAVRAAADAASRPHCATGPTLQQDSQSR